MRVPITNCLLGHAKRATIVKTIWLQDQDARILLEQQVYLPHSYWRAKIELTTFLRQ